MKAFEIRKAAEAYKPVNPQPDSQSVDFAAAQVFFLAEIAAQLAELNISADRVEEKLSNIVDGLGYLREGRR